VPGHAQQEVSAIGRELQVLDGPGNAVGRRLGARRQVADAQLEISGMAFVRQVGQQRPVRREPGVPLLAGAVGEDRDVAGLRQADPRSAMPGQLGEDRPGERDRGSGSAAACGRPKAGSCSRRKCSSTAM
jgi:hypothetical protein